METWHTIKEFLFNLRDICNGKNKGELVECRLCLEDTMPACFTNYIIDSEQYDYFLLSYRCWQYILLLESQV